MSLIELSEVAVEFNAILENMTSDIVNKIPVYIKKFFRNISSKTYKFEYDKSKKLNDQKIKLKTKALIAIIYKDYIAEGEEKLEYDKKCIKIFAKNENDFKVDKIFDKRNPSIENNQVHLIVKQDKNSWYKRLFNFLVKYIKRY